MSIAYCVVRISKTGWVAREAAAAAQELAMTFI
jgi:hypothetical protein